MSYTASLVEMFQHGFFIAEQTCYSPDMWEKGMQYSLWQNYRGPDCEAFNVYMRYRKDTAIISNINAVQRSATTIPVRKGRMPKIMDALFQVTPRVVVESVVSDELQRWLVNNDFTPLANHPHSYEKLRQS